MWFFSFLFGSKGSALGVISKATRALGLFLVVPAVAYAATDDPCVALIPPNGAYQIIDSSGNHTQFNTAKEMYCSNQFHSAQQANNWNFNLAAEGYGSASGGSSSQASDQDRSSFCGDSSKDLTSIDKSFLYRLQGDSTLVAGFVQCEQSRLAATQFTAYAATVTSTDSDVVLTIVPHLSANAMERINAIGLLGASEVPNVSIPVGTPLLPNVSVTSGYHLTADQATLFIRTTTGDKTVTVIRCKDGKLAGSVSASGTRVTQESQVVDHPSWTIQVPQASCHPHCHLGQGDVHTYTLPAPAGETLSNGQNQGCNGGGCPFEDLVSLTQPDDSHLVFSVRSRSEAVSYVITADGSQMVNVSTPVELLGLTNVNYGEPFSITVPSGVTNAVMRYGGLNVPLSGLNTGNWNGTNLFVMDSGSSPGDSGGMIYTFQVKGPSCSATATP